MVFWWIIVSMIIIMGYIIWSIKDLVENLTFILMTPQKHIK